MAVSPFRQRHYRSEEVRAIVRHALSQAPSRPSRGPGLSHGDLERLLSDLGIGMESPTASPARGASPGGAPMPQPIWLVGYFFASFPLLFGLLLGLHHRPVGSLIGLSLAAMGFLGTHACGEWRNWRNWRSSGEVASGPHEVRLDTSVLAKVRVAAHHRAGEEEDDEAADQRASTTARTVSSMDR